MKTEFDSNGKMFYVPDDNDAVPASYRQLQPKIYKDGDSYCCLLGANTTEGIFGCGSTPELAMEDWDRAYRDHQASIRNC